MARQDGRKAVTEQADVRTGQGQPKLDREAFAERYRQRFKDPIFNHAQAEIDRLIDLAWDGYRQGRKAPVTRKAGAGFTDPDYDLSVDWLAAHDAIIDAGRRQRDPASPTRVLLICGSPRTDDTCPGEMSKSFRLVSHCQETMINAGCEVDLLDLSRLTAEYGRVIYPCKACVSTSMALCHWPCSCYPNHSLGQVNDWMNEIYPRWMAAHGVMIVTPVHWYQAPSVLKLMMDRLVCADGGNPDPTSTHGKDAARAKQLELAGWPYPRHLAGRAFSVLVHADTEGANELRRVLADWLSDMHLIEAGSASIGRYIGYYQPYATSHQALDQEAALFLEVQNAATTLINKIHHLRAGQTEPDAELTDPRPK
ncbi:MAG: flavodoxin family protein [Rhodospirillaceae bacterium]|nr:MAG: flavodoxin family protein [Rhodospirillaceae bacterium]